MGVQFDRDADVEALSALLAAHRLVSIVGTGGVGKIETNDPALLAGALGVKLVAKPVTR